MLMTIDEEAKAQALQVAAARWGGEVRGGALHPIAPALQDEVQGDNADACQRQWYVVVTEPQHEQVAAAGLIGRGLSTYLPTFVRWVAHGRGKRREVTRPFFPGYVFAHLDLEHDRWQRIFSTSGVRGMLMAGEHPAIVHVAEVAKIRAAEERELQAMQAEAERRKYEEALAAAGKHDYRVGEQVRIVDGPFAGWVANITALDDGQRIALLLSLFGRATRTVVSATQIRRSGSNRVIATADASEH